MDDQTSELALLRREVAALRQRVAQLQRDAAFTSADDSAEHQTVSEREELLREAERITNTGSWVWDVDGEVFWSDQLFRILGYDPGTDQASAQAYFDRVHPDDVAYAQEVAARALQTGHTPEVDYRLALPSGEVRWISVNGSILPGSPLRIVGTVRDTTEERAAAIALAEAHRLEAVGELAGGVAHDFRNLLMVIQSQLELIGGIDPDARNTIEGAVNAATTVTAQLLAFGQQAELRPAPTDLSAVARRTAEVVAPLFATDHELNLSLANDPLFCRLDARHLGEALSSLLLYVRDAMPDGGHVQLSTQRDEQYHSIVIEDDRTLYSPDQRIFEPFFTLNSGGNVDLRMAMAHGIVVQHGGHIVVEASDRGGTRFVLRFKASRLSEDSSPSGSQRGDGISTIMVVDDQAPVARVVSRLLQNEGYHVLVADHPHRALEMYAAHADEIDLVLTDLAMPEMLGTELIAELKARHDVPNVVFMSGYAAEATQAISTDYELLHKPFTRDQLLQVLQQLGV